MQDTTENTSFFSDVCIDKCGGMCCDPWWGIISYTVVKEGGLSNLKSLRDELIKGIKARSRRIMDAYVTEESPRRRLFGSPQKYNVRLKDMRIGGGKLTLEVLAMFAFRCHFLSENKACSIHPSVLGGRDIRPPHCGYLGVLNARPGERGFCRIIHAAEASKGDTHSMGKAMEVEKSASLKHLGEGANTAEEAADKVIDEIKDYLSRNAGLLLPGRAEAAPGRNEPCHCGSGLKYKRCHGR